MSDLRAAVVGTGHLGRHHVRILAAMPGVEMIGAYDADAERLTAITNEHGVPALPSVEAAAEADAVVVATPTVSHREIAGRLLEAGCHVMVEKPIAATVAEGEELVAAAERHGRVLTVGHVEFHNPAVQAALARAEAIRYLEAQRLSPFTARSVDVDVVLDLMIHDLQIALALAGAEPTEVRAVGVPVLTGKVDLCHAWLEFASGLVANLTTSRVSSERVRKLRVFARDAYYSIDYAEQSVSSARLERRPDALPAITPQDVPVTKQEPLAAELASFLALCRGESAPHVDGPTATRALAVAIRIRDLALAHPSAV